MEEELKQNELNEIGEELEQEEIDVPVPNMNNAVVVDAKTDFKECLKVSNNNLNLELYSNTSNMEQLCSYALWLYQNFNHNKERKEYIN